MKKRRLTAIFTACILFFSLLPSAGDTVSFADSAVSGSDNEKLVILDFGNGDASLVSASASNGTYELTNEFADTGKTSSLKWTLIKGDKNIKADILFQRKFWQANADVVFKMYNSASANNTISLFFYTKSSGYKPIYRKKATLTPGWNEVVMTRNGIDASIPYENDLMISFNSGGWSISDYVTDSAIYIDSIYCVPPDYEKIASELLKSSAAIYAGASNAISGGTMLSLENPAVYKNETIFVPLTVLEELFGYEADSTSVLYKGISLGFSDGSKNAKAGAYDYTLIYPAFSKNGTIYAPLSDICKICQIPLKCNGRFALMGSDDAIDKINQYTDCGVNLAEEAIIKNITSHSDGSISTDCELVLKNWLKFMTGNEMINTSNDSTVKARIRSVDNNAIKVRQTLIKTEGSSELFEGENTLTTLDMRNTSHSIYQMARAYGTYGCELYKDEALLDDILYAVDWFYENRYGDDEAEKNTDAWRDRRLYNWYDWCIGVPANWIPTLMIIRDELTSDEINKYLTCFDAAVPTTTSSGSNYIHISRLIIGAAALKGDEERISLYARDAEKTFVYVDNGRNPESQLDSARSEYTPNRGHGFYRDGSYVYHTLHAMNGSYGMPHFNMAADLVAVLGGTSFEMPSYCVDNLADWFINSFDTLMYKNRMPRMVLGRSENPECISQARTLVSSALKCFDYFSKEDQNMIGSIIKEYSRYNNSNYLTAISFCDVEKFKEISASDEYNNYKFDSSNIFGNMDKAMHKRSDWAFAISMSSSRIFNYESINNANENGWYLGDGYTELILSDEGAASASPYWQYMNYYRLPGTTVDTQPRKAVSIAQGNEYLSTKDFVGGAELNEKYLTVAMHLESYHNATDFGTDKNSYGTLAPAHTNDLTAKKSWFTFDKSVICLGADVSASDNNNAYVHTVIDNRLINEKIVSDLGEISLSDTDENPGDVSWLNLDDKLGYWFPSDSGANLGEIKLRQRDNTLSYFEAIFDHGVNPDSSSYAYGLLPNMTSTETANYAKNPDTVILSNTGSVQAVRNTELGITSIVFWEAGSFEGITVSHPMIVMLEEKGSLITLAVSDPTQKLTDAVITIDRTLLLTDSHERIAQTQMGAASSFSINFRDSLGATIQAKMKHSVQAAENLKLTDSDGNAQNLYLAHMESEVNASVGVTNLSDETCDVRFVIAMYNSSGTLQAVHTFVETVSAGEEKQMQSVALSPTKDTVLIKGFVWDAETLKPMTN